MTPSTHYIVAHYMVEWKTWGGDGWLGDCICPTLETAKMAMESLSRQQDEGKMPRTPLRIVKIEKTIVEES